VAGSRVSAIVYMMSRTREVTNLPSAAIPIVDARAPRFNQALIGLAALSGAAFHAWPVAALAAIQLLLSLTLGSRACLACAIYFRWIQPRLGPGATEDARPVRFANLVGFLFLSTATLSHVAGRHGLERGLTSIVATLALVAAASGFCAGCWMYRLLAGLRGIRLKKVSRIDLDEIGAARNPGLVVQFTHPRCTDCIELENQLRRQGVPLAIVDVSKHPDLARKYGISVVPLAFQVGSDGQILGRVTPRASS